MVMNKHKVKSLKFSSQKLNQQNELNVNTRIYGIWKYLYTRSTLLNCSDILFWYNKADLIEVIARYCSREGTPEPLDFYIE